MDNRPEKDKNVREMTNFKTNTGFTPLAQVEAYWEALRGARLMPMRSDIDPRGIEQALEYTFIVERIAPGIARFRIAGSHLSDLMGMEIRGMPLTSLIAPDFRRQVSDTLEEVFETPAICELTLEGPADKNSRPEMNAKMLLLPLKSDLGDVSRILGCLVTQGEIGHAPRRFNVLRSDLRAIKLSGAPQRPNKVPPTAAPDFLQAQIGMMEPTVPFNAGKEKRKFPHYLRLVKSD